MKINFWEIPLISAIITLLSILVPFWSRVNSGILQSVWSWGLICDTNYIQYYVGFLNNSIYLTVGFLFTFLEVITLNILLIITYRIWRNDIDLSNIRIFSFIAAIILIISPIFLVIGAYIADPQWSKLYIPTLGFILPFIGAFFSFMTVMLSQKYVKTQLQKLKN